MVQKKTGGVALERASNFNQVGFENREKVSVTELQSG